MSSVLPLPFAKENGYLHLPTLKETSLDPDDYLLRLAEMLRIDLASSLGLPTSAIGSVESWVEQVEEFGLKEFLEDDQKDCQENIPPMEPQEVGAKLMEVMSGIDSLACIEYDNILIPPRMPGYRQQKYGQEQHDTRD